MTALKHAYQGEGYVLRLFESFGAETETTISVGDVTFTAKFSPYEIKTFKVTACGKVQEVDFLEWDI